MKLNGNNLTVNLFENVRSEICAKPQTPGRLQGRFFRHALENRFKTEGFLSIIPLLNVYKKLDLDSHLTPAFSL